MSQEIIFMGEFEVSVDNKNRIVIPSKWRENLGRDLVITEGFEGALELRTKQKFIEYLSVLNTKDQYSKHVRVLKRRILGGSREIFLDKWYRFGVPSSFKSLHGEAIMIGNGDSIEIWRKQDYEDWCSDSNNSLEKAALILAKE